jgi:hypothetical protein
VKTFASNLLKNNGAASQKPSNPRRRANRRGLGAAGDGVSAGFFIHPLLAIDSETEAVLGLLDAQIWTRDDAIEAAPRRQRAIEDKESMR